MENVCTSETVKRNDGVADRFLYIERLSCGRFPHRVIGLSGYRDADRSSVNAVTAYGYDV